MSTSLTKLNKPRREQEETFTQLQVLANARLNRLAAPEKHADPTAATLEELDARAWKRMSVDYPALVICEEDEDTAVIITDLSVDGLRLRFSRPHHLQKHILIDSPAFKGFVVGAVRWQNGFEAGVEFDHVWTSRLSAPLR